ncbi:MAG: hypothetical protein HY360_16995 [Verrucomicrobia bacterium]|nr:hypothetical protein [Verrucomicrobiota bacterium]
MNRQLPLFAHAAACLLCLSALFNGFFVFQQMLIHQDLQNLNAEAAKIPKAAQLPQLQREFQNLMNDMRAYGQKQPAIHPLIQKYGGNLPPPPPLPTPAP